MVLGKLCEESGWFPAPVTATLHKKKAVNCYTSFLVNQLSRTQLVTDLPPFSHLSSLKLWTVWSCWFQGRFYLDAGVCVCIREQKTVIFFIYISSGMSKDFANRKNKLQHSIIRKKKRHTKGLAGWSPDSSSPSIFSLTHNTQMKTDFKWGDKKHSLHKGHKLLRGTRQTRCAAGEMDYCWAQIGALRAPQDPRTRK